jgi:hypothetical protein
MTTDKVFAHWLQRQHEDATALAAASDVLALAVESGAAPPRRFLVRFACPTLVRAGNEVERTDGFLVHFQFAADHLRVPPDPGRLVNLLEPRRAFHPNVAPPFVCIGHVAPGTGLVELIHQVHEIMTYQKLTPREDDALDRDACAWARRHAHLFPLTTAPLRRRAADFSIRAIALPQDADGRRRV